MAETCDFCGDCLIHFNGHVWHNPACAKSDLHADYLAEVEHYLEMLTVRYPDGVPADWLRGNRGDVGNEAALTAARRFNGGERAA